MKNDNENKDAAVISLTGITILIIFIIIGCFNYKDSGYENGITKTTEIENATTPPIPKETEITFADFEDFGITFDEFVQEYNNSENDGEINPHAILYFGIPSHLDYAEEKKFFTR